MPQVVCVKENIKGKIVNLQVKVKIHERRIYTAQGSAALKIKPGDRCLCEFDYDLEDVVVLKIREVDYHNDKNEGTPPRYKLLRKLTLEDRNRIAQNKKKAERATNAFMLSVKTEKTPVTIISMRFSFNCKRLYIRYSAQTPTDLRRFIKQLQRDFQTQVDILQVTGRDESALLGCLGHCGREACCCSWMSGFEKVSVRMARVQDVSLSPAHLHGSCGEVKCCLRFEYEQYQELDGYVPKPGSLVVAELDKRITGVVIDRNILGGIVGIKTDNGNYLRVSVAKIVEVKNKR